MAEAVMAEAVMIDEVGRRSAGLCRGSRFTSTLRRRTIAR